MVVTPHLGASTAEAQDKAGDTIAEQVALALAGEFVPFAVNVERGGGVEHRPPVPAARRAPRAALRRAGRRRPRRDRDRLRGPAGRLGHPHPHALGAQGPLRPGERGAGQLRQRAAARRGARHRGPRVVELDVTRLRQPRHDPRRRPRHRRHPRGAAVGAAPRDGRRPLGGRPAGRPHARRPQRRRARDDRLGHRRAGRGRHQHRRHAPRPLRARAARPSWCWPPTAPCPTTCRGPSARSPASRASRGVC